MPDLTAAQFAALMHAPAPPDAQRPVRGFTHHSARVRPGDAFFALPGLDHHGIEHAEDALARGASLVVSDQRHPRGLTVADPVAALERLGRLARARLRAPVVGITGSAGKTTAKALVAAATGGRPGSGNLNTPWALASELFGAWLDDLRAPLVVELGIDRVGEMQDLLSLVRPDLGLLTSIAPSHLSGLGDVATVAREKGRLLEAAPRGLAAEGAWQRLPLRWRERVLRYRLDDARGAAPDVLDDAAVPWRGIPLGSPLQPRLRLLTPAGPVDTDLPGPGAGLAESAVGAVALADRLGHEVAAAAARLAHAALEPRRLQPLRYGELWVLDDSYNANPASARPALDLLRACPAPHVAVLGDMLELGERSAELHRELVAETRGLDRVLLVGPELRAAADANPQAEVVDLEGAAEALRGAPQRGTVLLKASRGLRFEGLLDALRREGVA